MKIYTCDCCGLCCHRLIVEADAVDVIREPRIETERPLGKRDPTLAILEASWVLAGPGMPCPFLTSDHNCRIYPTRPATCVGFAAGSAKCHQLRREHGISALAPAPTTHSVVAEILHALTDD